MTLKSPIERWGSFFCGSAVNIQNTPLQHLTNWLSVVHQGDAMQVEVERVLNASKEKLYGMWTKPEMISTWMGVKVEIEPKVGGSLTIDFGEKDLTTGTFKELIPFDKVSFTWFTVNGDEPSGETLVTITLEEVSPGKTKMKLVHSGFRTELARSEHDFGWKQYFTGWETKLAQ